MSATRQVRVGNISVAEAKRAVALASSRLLGGEHAVDDDVVLDLVAHSQCTAYDCEFAGLAATLGTILVTEDRELQASFPRLCRSLDHALAHGLGR